MLGGVLLPAVFAAALGWFVWHERSQLEPITEAPVADLVLIAVLVALSQALSSVELWLLYRAQGAPAGAIESWFLFVAGQLANHLPAQAGTLYRLHYMQVVHQVPYGGSVAVYGALLVATFGGAAVAGLVAIVAISTGGDVPVAMALVYGAMGAAAVAMVVLPLPALSRSTGRVARGWRAARNGFEQIRSDPVTAGGVILVEAVRYVVLAWRFQVAFALIDLHEPFWFFLGLAPAAGVAGFVAVTPGAFGFREAFVAGAAVGLGSALDSGVLAATLDRGVMFAVTILVGGVGLAATYPRLRSRRAARASLIVSGRTPPGPGS